MITTLTEARAYVGHLVQDAAALGAPDPLAAANRAVEATRRGLLESPSFTDEQDFEFGLVRAAMNEVLA